MCESEKQKADRIKKMKEKQNLTPAVADRGFAPWVSGAILIKWLREKPRRGQNCPGS